MPGRGRRAVQNQEIVHGDGVTWRRPAERSENIIDRRFDPPVEKDYSLDDPRPALPIGRASRKRKPDKEFAKIVREIEGGH